MGVVLDLLFPPRCTFCHCFTERGSVSVCPDCRRNLPRTEHGGAQRGDGFQICVAPLYYEKDVRASLHRYKFGRIRHYADTYGPMLADCIRENLSGRYDLITWVPLSRKRLRERGFDQAKLLAESAARALGERAGSTLKKTRNIQKQSTIGDAAQRRSNVMGVYAVPDSSFLAGRRVLLIDDIVTTGSTLSECARTLTDAGAAEVVCAALARTRKGAPIIVEDEDGNQMNHNPEELMIQ